MVNFVALSGMTEELFTNTEYIASHAAMLGGHPVPGALVYSFAEGLVLPLTLRGSGVAFLSMELDIKGPTYVGDTIHVEIEVSEIKPTSKDPERALVRTANTVKNQKGEIRAGLHAPAADAGALDVRGRRQGRCRARRSGHDRLHRPLAEARNAVDPRDRRRCSREAFRAFDADDSTSVGDPDRRGRHLLRRRRPARRCGTPAQPRRARRRRADGADPDAAAQAGHRRDRGPRGRRRARARALVRPAGRRRGRRASASSAGAGACR